MSKDIINFTFFFYDGWSVKLWLLYNKSSVNDGSPRKYTLIRILNFTTCKLVWLQVINKCSGSLQWIVGGHAPTPSPPKKTYSQILENVRLLTLNLPTLYKRNMVNSPNSLYFLFDSIKLPPQIHKILVLDLKLIVNKIYDTKQWHRRSYVTTDNTSNQRGKKKI